MSTSHDAGPATNHGGATAIPASQAPAAPAAPLPDESVALTHGQKWAEFYEALDQLVHDNFDRSNELLREAMVLPTVADQEVAAIRRQAAERIAGERRRHGELLQPISEEVVKTATELADMQQRMSELSARLTQLATSVMSAIETINREVPVAVPAPTVDVGPAPVPDQAPPSLPSVDERSVETAAAPAVVVAEAPLSGPVSQRLIVHGVRQARLALSLQRHLYGLSHVDGVETREYQNGTVQLQVRSSRPLTLDDLQSWSDGDSLEIERMTQEQVIARLPEAGGNAGKARAGRWWGSREAASNGAGD